MRVNHLNLPSQISDVVYCKKSLFKDEMLCLDQHIAANQVSDDSRRRRSPPTVRRVWYVIG